MGQTTCLTTLFVNGPQLDILQHVLMNLWGYVRGKPRDFLFESIQFTINLWLFVAWVDDGITFVVVIAVFQFPIQYQIPKVHFSKNFKKVAKVNCQSGFFSHR